MSFKLLLRSVCTSFTPRTLFIPLVLPGKICVCFKDTKKLRGKDFSKVQRGKEEDQRLN